MYTVFITGSLASGKGTACRYLAQKGFTHLDLDDLAKEFLEDADVQQELIKAYGQSIRNQEGGINRAQLARLAFRDKESSAPLNNLMWPLVAARLAELIDDMRNQANHDTNKLLVEIAMLAEAPIHLELADAILCVTADEGLRIERALKRGMQLDDIVQRMALQASDAERSTLADLVLENNKDLASLHAQLDSWLETL